ncbi:MAG TPA: transaldolase [Burkholderiales bacterium]|jgi:transaldolase|nr:transaldolase [Burkholderiales bacterium]
MPNNNRLLRDIGQSLWLDNISRGLLTSGTLKRYVDEFGVTGLTSNPTIFDEAIKKSDFYDEAIARRAATNIGEEELFVELALEDLRNAAELFLPAYRATQGVDGWVSMEVSPFLAHDAAGSAAEAKRLQALAQCENLLIKIPGTAEGVVAIEESIFAGVPVNVTLLFSTEQYLAAAHAYVRGIERRVAAGLDPKITSVASIFVSRWDKATADKLPAELKNRVGIASGMRSYREYVSLFQSERWQKLAGQGARPQRLLWASTGTKDPALPDTLYLEALAAPDTVNTIPEKTLHAYADHGKLNGVMPADGGDCEKLIAQIEAAGVSLAQVAATLQQEGEKSFNDSWTSLMGVIRDKAGAARAKRA